MENKLISRNPIYRFKLGRKIIKAQFGTDKIKIGMDVPKIYYLIPLYDLETILKVSSIPSVPTRPYPYRGPEVKIGILKIPDISPSVTSVDPYLTSGSTKGGMQREYEQNLINNLASKKSKPKKASVNNIWIKGFNRYPEVKDVRAMLQKLIDLGLLKDLFGADGKWGKNTEAAYLKYLLLLNVPTYEKPEMPSVAEMTGIYSEENKPLYQRIRFKLGGQLVSRNPIKRFKLNKK